MLIVSTILTPTIQPFSSPNPSTEGSPSITDKDQGFDTQCYPLLHPTTTTPTMPCNGDDVGNNLGGKLPLLSS